MRVHLANRDRTADIGRQVTDAAVEMAARKDAPEYLPLPHSAVLLASSENGSVYLDRLVSLLMAKTGASTSDFYIPRRPGFVGVVQARFKALLWRLLRYQHERIALQQNMINFQLAASIEFIREEQRRKIREIEDRIAALESAGNCGGKRERGA